MNLRKDDPLYYKLEMEKLIIGAKENGLKIIVGRLDKGVKIYFEADNGDVMGIILTENKEES